MNGDNNLIKIEDMRLFFRTERKEIVQAVDGVSLTLGRKPAVVIVGESGCGKTTFARALLRLLPRNVHTYTGQIHFNGTDLMQLSEERFRREVRWTKFAVVPQAAMNALNPVMKIGDQIAEPLLAHGLVSGKKEAEERARSACGLVGLPLDFLNRFAFELSGGMRQRTAIATALITNPALVILDEPTSALDVLTQANIMNLLKKIKQEFNTKFVLITHDIATSSELADEMAVMYAAQVVEHCDTERFYRQPLHPYSQRLMASVPTLRGDKKLQFIPGEPPSLLNPPSGCRFAERCPSRFGRCEEEPPFEKVEADHWVKCWLY